MLAFALFCGFVSVVLCEDYYSVLGLTKQAKQSDIKQAYRKLAFANHPDKHPNDEGKKKIYQKVTEAYEVLSDEEKRRIYDQYGVDGLKNGVRNQGFDFDDIFSNIFGGGQRKQSDQLPKGNPIKIKVQITLEDLYLGKEIEVLQRRQVLCPHCRGSGAESSEDIKSCQECGGQGTKIITQKLGPGFMQKMQTTCDKCGGKGKIITKVCSHCHGKKVDVAEQMLTIFVEKGMPDGHEIVLDSDGDERPGEEPGDIVFKLNTVPHRRFDRKGNDLYLNVTISLLQALIGFQKTFKHLDGHEVSFSRDTVTKPGLQMVLTGEGMPHYGFATQKGDLIITFIVQFPTTLTEEQKEGFKNLLK